MRKHTTRQTPRRHNGHGGFHIQKEMNKIRNAFAETVSDLSDKTSEMFSDSVDSIKEQSENFQDQVISFYPA